jgi:hypothetical protein
MTPTRSPFGMAKAAKLTGSSAPKACTTTKWPARRSRPA